MDSHRRRRQSADAQPNNLPRYLTSFVGRTADLFALKKLVAGERMITLTGPGGAGKSRLAAELIASSSHRWPDGAWWVELASVREPGQVPGAVLNVLELAGRGAAQDVVTAWLASRRAAVVLDNCEHLVGACARFSEAALKRCPDLTIVATSREALRVPGEANWIVSSLTDSDAINLFEARGRLAVPDFKVSPSNRDLVAEIGSRLDGIPLAIELAAARMGMMTESEILTRLSDRFLLLRGGSRTAPERQQTMMAAIDWSYGLLTPGEATLFRRLSVFRGGFTLESAEAVCADSGTDGILGFLTGLVQKSMVVADRSAPVASRYRLLESQLAYAEERLNQSGEGEVSRRRHYEYFVATFGPGTNVRSSGSPDVPIVNWLRWRRRELANLWAAVDWAKRNTHDLGLGLAAEVAIAQFGDRNREAAMMRDLLQRSPATGGVRAKALFRTGWLTLREGDFSSALDFAQRSLTIAKETGDPDFVAYILNLVGTVQQMSGYLDDAAKSFDEAVTIASKSADRRLARIVANSVGMLAAERGDYVRALNILSGSVAGAESDPSFPAFLESLANAQLGNNDVEGAAANWKRSLALDRDLDQWVVLSCLEGLSRAAIAHGDHQRGLRLAAAARRMADEWSLKTDVWSTRMFDEAVTESRARLGSNRSKEAWSQGWALSLDGAIDYALGDTEQGAEIVVGPLTRREQTIAKLVAQGMTNHEIAKALFLSDRTVEGHVQHVLTKLGFNGRAQIAVWAEREGLLTADRGPT